MAVRRLLIVPCDQETCFNGKRFAGRVTVAVRPMTSEEFRTKLVGRRRPDHRTWKRCPRSAETRVKYSGAFIHSNVDLGGYPSVTSERTITPTRRGGAGYGRCLPLEFERFTVCSSADS